eukprot:500082-Pyramimonas_sp.AAC.1
MLVQIGTAVTGLVQVANAQIQMPDQGDLRVNSSSGVSASGGPNGAQGSPAATTTLTTSTATAPTTTGTMERLGLGPIPEETDP